MKQSQPTLREFWFLLNSYDWEGHRMERDECAVLSKNWHARNDLLYDRILVVAQQSDEHSELATAFHSAMLKSISDPKPPLPR